MSIIVAISIGVVIICWCIISTTNAVAGELAAIRQANEMFHRQALKDLTEMSGYLLDLTMKN